MRDSSKAAARAYIVEVAFFSGDIGYGAETYHITASSWYQAELEALARSVESPYDNDRVPDARRRAEARAA